MTDKKPRKKTPDLTVAATQERLDKIVRRRALYEWPWAKIAAEVDMTERACRDAYSKWLAGDRHAIMGEDEVETVQRMLYRHREAQQILLGTIDESRAPETCKECGKACGHVARPGVVVGAVRGMMDVEEKDIVIRQLASLLPRDLGQVRHIIKGRKLVETFFEVIDQQVKAKKITAEIADSIEQDLVSAIGMSAAKALPMGRLVDED